MSDSVEPTPEESEGIHVGRVLAVGAITLVIFSVATGLVWLLTGAGGPGVPAPAELGQPEVGIVDQRPFALDARAEQLRQAQRARLEGFGWVDRDAGLIHVPVERAMEQLLASPGGGPP